MALLLLLGILHSSLVAGNGLVGSHSLLRAYSALRDLHELHDKQSATTTTMQVPLLALLGVQSSGKTSMVDSIVGWPVGYTSRGTATRCPVRYILRGSPNRTYSVAGRPVLDRGGLRAAVQAHMEALAKSSGFTSKVLEVSIAEPNLITLDVTDLPGLKDPGLSSAQDRGEQSDYEQLRNMTKTFLRDPRTIPVVMCQASKSHETQHDLDILRELGLSLDKTVLLVNYFNKQLPDISKISSLNAYTRGFHSKYPGARFLMLHYKDGIDKESMSMDELEDYIQQLPRKEQRQFDEHVRRMEQDEALDPALTEALGVTRAISHVQSILLEWMRDNSRDVVSSLHADVLRHEQTVDQLQQMIDANNPRTIKDAWRNYTLAYENIISMMQYGRIAHLQLPAPLYHLGPRDQWADTQTVVSTYGEEVMKVSVPKPRGWLEIEALDEQLQGTYTGRQLHLKLGPHAAFSRLVRVLSYMLFSMNLEPLTEEEMMTKSGHSRDGTLHTFNKHTVIMQLVTYGLLQMQGIVAVAMQQVRVIYIGVLRQAHQSLRQFFPIVAHHELFHKMLDSKYEELLMQKLAVGTRAIQDRIVTKTKFLSVDLPNRILMLFGLTPMIQDILQTDPKSAYHEENNSEANDTSHRLPARNPSKELPSIATQRKALLAMKLRLFEHQQQSPFSMSDFVEGGQQDLHQDEYRSINVDDINKAATQYWVIIKGLLCLEVEGILDFDVYQMVENKEILLRSMREEMLQAVSDLKDEEVHEIVGSSFVEMVEEQRQANVTLSKLRAVHAELETALSSHRTEAPTLESYLLLPAGLETLERVAREAKADVVNFLHVPSHTVGTHAEPDPEHRFVRVVLQTASAQQSVDDLSALVARTEGKLPLKSLSSASTIEAIFAASKSKCVSLLKGNKTNASNPPDSGEEFPDV